MARWSGMVVGNDSVTVVDLMVEDDQRTVVRDHTYSLQAGDRPRAYRVLHEEILNHCRENGVEHVVVKGSAVTGRGMKLGHLHNAEVRGVALAAAASVCADVRTATKASISRNFGTRKADEYLCDSDWWNSSLEGAIRKGSREAALVVLSEVDG